MARFCSLYSSSSGNSTYIGSSKTAVLIDAGVSAKKLKEALLSREIDPSALGGIFITHEHSDHINGMRILASTYNIPVYATEGTMAFLEENGKVTNKFPYEVIPYEGMQVGDIFVKPFRTPHDSRESCGYRIEMPGDIKAAI
ncbi:MAG: MBL fold metallo-hydrolase, partial [Clostridia bacterium]|nr:MBL fold metallo-hydrolase [Clostridia bacterium]